MTLTVPIALVALLAMVVGAIWRIWPADTARDSPLTQATAVALAMATGWPPGPDGPDALGGLAGPLLLVGVAAVVAALVQREPGSVLPRLAPLLVSAVVAGLLVRIPGPEGLTLLLAAEQKLSRPVLVAGLLLLVAVVAFLLPLVVASARRSVASRTSVRQYVVEDLGRHGPLTLATATTAVVMALGLPVLGPASLVLFLFPLAVLQMAVGRQGEIREAQLQTVGALARLTDHAGLTASGHGDRVADLAVPVARDVGVEETDLRGVEAAALLHDLGQVGLTSPIPGGATIEVSGHDQRRIAAAGAAILARTAQLSALSAWVADVGVPHHRAVERGDVALVSRVIRVVSAYDDLTGHGTRLTGAEDPLEALERLLRSTPHDYDPAVVIALVRQLERRGVITHRQGARLRA